MSSTISSHAHLKKEYVAWALFGIILLSLAIYYFSFLDERWAPTPDSAYYVSLAQSIAHGKGYTFDGNPHIKYPPGLPLLLAPSYFFQKPYLYDHALIVSFVLGIMAVVYIYFRNQLGILWCLLLVVLIGCSFWLWQFSCVFILSDVPLAAFVLFTCLAGRAFLNTSSPSWRLTIGLTVLLIFSCLIRTIGVVLLPALIASAIVKKASKDQWKKIAAALGLSILVLVGWALRNHFAGQQLIFAEDTYVKQFLWNDPYNKDEGRLTPVGILDRMAANLVHYARASEALFLNRKDISEHGVPVIGLLILALAIGSSVYQLKRSGEVHDFFVIIYCAALLLWPSQAGVRFLLPIFVLILYSLWETVPLLFHRLIARLPASFTAKTWMSSISAAFVALLCLGLSARGILHMQASCTMKNSVVSHSSPLVSLGEWVKNEATTQPIVFSNIPSIVHNLQRLKESAASYMLIRESHEADRAFLVPLVYCFPEAFSLQKKAGEFLLYKIDRGSLASINLRNVRSWNAKTITKEYGPNLVLNGGFELTDAEGNPGNWANCQNTRIDRQNSYRGQNSLTAKAAENEPVNWYFPSQTVQVKPGRPYRLCGLIKGDGVGDKVMIEAQDARSYKEGLWRTATLSGTFDWERLETEFTTAPGTEEIRIYPLRIPLFKEGRVWVDEVALQEVTYHCAQ
jgi:4-amino-4-deoxy-L-arabinose transferase-like glycosyltransferase